METVFDKASADDYEEIVDLTNYAFSYSLGPSDFTVSLSKLFKSEYFMDGFHYLAREKGKIKAHVGAYPLEITIEAAAFKGQEKGICLPGRGIALVAVHPYRRFKGYMQVLLKQAMREALNDGMAYCCLGGQRQRYEYFGFTPAGINYTFTCASANVTHILGRQWESSLSLDRLSASDSVSLDQIYAMHKAKNIRVHRERGKLFDILSSWRAETFVASEGGRFEGYLVHREHRVEGSVVTEFNLKDLSRLPELIGLFLRTRKDVATKVWICPHEREKIARLSGFAEQCAMGSAYQFAVLDYARFADAFLKIKAAQQKIPQGSFVFHVKDEDMGIDTTVRLFSGSNGAGAEITDEKPALILNSLEATRFLAFHPTAMTHPVIQENDFLRGILPLPVFWENVDAL